MSEASLLAAALERALNHYLALDPDSPRRLQRLLGRRVDLEILGLRLRFSVARNGVQLLSQDSGTPDAVLRGSPAALARLKLADNPGKALVEGEVRIEGDSAVAQDFGDLLGGVDIDWEELAAHMLGDVAAHRLGRWVRGAVGWARRSADGLARDLGEYLQEESRQLPARSEVEALLDDIDRLRSDLDRLAARIERLERRNEDTEV